MPPLDILIVVRDGARRQALARALGQAGHRIIPLARLEEGAEEVGTERPDILALDLRDPTLDRTAVLAAVMAPRVVRPESLEAVERRHIATVLAHTGGNRRQAARLLGIARSTLLNKIRRYDLRVTSGRSGSTRKP